MLVKIVKEEHDDQQTQLDPKPINVEPRVNHGEKQTETIHCQKDGKDEGENTQKRAD